MMFDRQTVLSYDEWLKSPLGYYIDKREKKLVQDLLAPEEGERLLDVGCKTGNYLLFFRRRGCDVTGLDSCPFMLEAAQQRLGNRADFHRGDAHDLPFSDNEFDIVTLITSLEFVENPQRALSEAIRVSRGRVFLGSLNRYSPATAQRKATGIFQSSISDFGLWETHKMVKQALAGTSIRWGSAIFFPLGWYSFAQRLEETIPSMKNPFGSFLGLVFPVVYTHTTLQEPLEHSMKVRTAARHHMPGTARETEK